MAERNFRIYTGVVFSTSDFLHQKRKISGMKPPDRISKRYRCRRLNAYGIKRFRAFFARKFTDDSIDAKGLILGIAQI